MFRIIMGVAVAGFVAFLPAQEPTPPTKFTDTTTIKWVARKGIDHPTNKSHRAFFIHRNKMQRTTPIGVFKLASVPNTNLPVDCTGNRTVIAAMDGNDNYGDCGEAMVEHCDNILTYAQGKRKQSSHAQSLLVSQYLKISGGDNGMNEDMVVGTKGVWRTGIAGDKLAICVDAADFDASNVALTRYLIDQFYTVQLAWSVPDAFLDQFQTGAQFLSPMTPNPNNGHYTPLASINKDGNYELWTWGGWCLVSPKFIASVEPILFVAFSPRQFDPATGYDSHGRHIATQAAAWKAGTGRDIAPAVINSFPPPGAPVPVPVPTPTPTPTPTGTTYVLTVDPKTGAYTFMPSAAKSGIMLTPDMLKTLQQIIDAANQAPAEPKKSSKVDDTDNKDRLVKIISDLRPVAPTLLEECKECTIKPIAVNNSDKIVIRMRTLP